MEGRELVVGKVYQYEHPTIRGGLCGEYAGRTQAGTYKFVMAEEAGGPFYLNESELGGIVRRA